VCSSDLHFFSRRQRDGNRENAMTSTEFLDFVYSYIEQSPQWPLFPVSPTTKRPLIKTGRDHAEHASTDPAQIERWITREFRGCGIGMPTGAASGTVVVDADVKNDGPARLAELEAEIGPLPREREVETQNAGRHIYCAHPGGGVRVRTGQGPRSPLGYLVGAGLDVRADGGIVVLPPTKGYRWIADDDGPLPPLPRLWLLAIQGAGEPPPPPRREYPRHGDRRWSDPERGGPICSGERNGRLFAIGAAIHFAGATDAEVIAHLERANAARCQPALSAREVAKIAASACRAQGRR